MCPQLFGVVVFSKRDPNFRPRSLYLAFSTIVSPTEWHSGRVVEFRAGGNGLKFRLGPEDEPIFFEVKIPKWCFSRGTNYFTTIQKKQFVNFHLSQNFMVKPACRITNLPHLPLYSLRLKCLNDVFHEVQTISQRSRRKNL